MKMVIKKELSTLLMEEEHIMQWRENQRAY